MMEPVYYAMSWLLLRLHWLWDAVLPDRRLLGTDWDWILAVVGVAIVLRLALLPLFAAQLRMGRRLREIEPRLAELRAQHGNDPEALRLETTKLYQETRVNPLPGCLFLLLVLPILFGLYHVLRSRDPLGFQPYTDVPKTLYGWTPDQFDSAAAAQLFTAPITSNLVTEAGATRIVAGVLVVVMVAMTFLNVRRAGPERGAARYVLPVIVLIAAPWFPIGLSVFWVTWNLISLVQQIWALRRSTVPVTT
jgi:YidC/Oxa1 family membrane protein insertase